MPGYKGHIIGAVAAGVVYVGTIKTVRPETFTNTTNVLTEWQMITGLMVIVVLFGLWPDIDTNSKGQDIFFTIGFLADIALIATGRIEAAAFLGLLAMTPIIGKHRGWTHSKIAMVVVPAPILIVTYLYRDELFHIAILLYGAAVVGYFSHLLLDGKITRKIHVKAHSYSD